MTKFELSSEDAYKEKVDEYAFDAIKNTKDVLVQALLNEIRQVSAVNHYLEYDIARFQSDTFSSLDLDVRTAAGILQYSLSDPDDADSLVYGIKDAKHIVEVLGNRTLENDVYNRIIAVVQNIVNDFNESVESEEEAETDPDSDDLIASDSITDIRKKEIAEEAVEGALI